MKESTIEPFRDFVHVGSLVLLCLVVLIALIGIVKPDLLRNLFRDFTQRKYVLATAVFCGLICGTIFVATQSPPQKESQQANSSSSQAGNLYSGAANNHETKNQVEEVIEDIPFAKSQQADGTLPENETKIVREGVVGKKRSFYNVYYNEGKEVSRQLEKEEIISQPISEITAVGTAKVLASNQEKSATQTPSQQPQSQQPQNSSKPNDPNSNSDKPKNENSCLLKILGLCI